MMEVQQFIIAILEAPDMSFETCSAPVTWKKYVHIETYF
jgi:hypothetical protein